MERTFDADCEESMISAELLQESAELLERVKLNIAGRSADVSAGGINTRIYACLSVLKGDGDILEIGSFFGASAITAALLRKAHGIRGHVVCLDPLDGRLQMTDNRQQETGALDEISGKEWSAETLLDNAKRNGVDLQLVQKASLPFPPELIGRRFTVAFIDGDHWHDAPMQDFCSVADLTNTDCVIFDDCDEQHPHVVSAVHAAKNEGWKITLEENTLCVLERLD